jgi:hypothetical protein
MRGPEVGVDAKAWGRGIDREAGALAQAGSSTRSALQIRRRIVTAFRQARGDRLKSGPLERMPARSHGNERAWGARHTVAAVGPEAGPQGGNGASGRALADGAETGTACPGLAVVSALELSGRAGCGTTPRRVCSPRGGG